MKQQGTDSRHSSPARLRRLFWTITLMLMSGSFCLAQDAAAAPQISDFAGTWHASFRNKTWLILSLVRSGNSMKGTLTHSLQIVADDNGELTGVSDEMTDESKINRAELEGETLLIRAEDSEGLADNYEMKLTGPESAELRSVADEEQASPRRPVRLKRVAHTGR